MHKHFRMIALASFMRNHGYDPEVDEHTRIPAIWEKLETLYNLEAIDERENYENDEDKHLDFDLPKEYEIEQFMRGRRGSSSPASEAPTSPAQYDRSPSPPKKRSRRETGARKRGSTVDDTDEPRTSPPASPVSKTTRRGRAATRSSGRTRAESSSRAPSKDTAMEDDEVEESEEAEDEEEDDEDDVESVAASEKQSRGRPRASTASTRKSKRKR